MNTTATLPHQPVGFELRCTSLFNEGHTFAFPCDAAGNVDLDGLSERARNNYFYGRTSIGGEFSFPAVRGGVVH